MKRICCRCGKKKDLEKDFHKDSRKKHGRRYYCKNCANKEQRNIRIRKGKPVRKEKTYINSRDKYLQKQYGITIERYFEMWSDCEGRCEICKKLVPQPFVDHDHKTGKVRGLLCADCNLGLGLFKDKIDNLDNAIKYLKERG